MHKCGGKLVTEKDSEGSGGCVNACLMRETIGAPYAFPPLTIGFGVDPLTIRCARNAAAVTPPYVPCPVVGARGYPESASGSPELPPFLVLHSTWYCPAPIVAWLRRRAP